MGIDHLNTEEHFKEYKKLKQKIKKKRKIWNKCKPGPKDDPQNTVCNLSKDYKCCAPFKVIKDNLNPNAN